MTIRRVHHLLVFLGFVTIAAHAQAQPFHYIYDSTFVLGGYDINRTALIDTAKEILRWNTIGFYQGPHKLEDSVVAGDSSAWRMKQLLQRMHSHGLKTMYAVGHIP